MNLPPLEPARRDESNGGGFILLRPLDAELFDEMSTNWHFVILRHVTFRQITLHLVVVEG